MSSGQEHVPPLYDIGIQCKIELLLAKLSAHSLGTGGGHDKGGVAVVIRIPHYTVDTCKLRFNHNVCNHSLIFNGYATISVVDFKLHELTAK